MYSTDTQANNMPTGEPPTPVIHDDDHLARGVPAMNGVHGLGMRLIFDGMRREIRACATRSDDEFVANMQGGSIVHWEIKHG
jgi:hypothetical protein